MAQYAELTEKNGWLKSTDQPAYAFVSGWTQFSHKLLLAKNINPSKVRLNFSYVEKWAVVSSTPTETTVAMMQDRNFREPPNDPQQLAGTVLVFETKKIPGEGWRIVVGATDTSDGFFLYENQIARRYNLA